MLKSSFGWKLVVQNCRKIFLQRTTYIWVIVQFNCWLTFLCIYVDQLWMENIFDFFDVDVGDYHRLKLFHMIHTNWTILCFHTKSKPFFTQVLKAVLDFCCWTEHEKVKVRSEKHWVRSSDESNTIILNIKWIWTCSSICKQSSTSYFVFKATDIEHRTTLQ